MSRCTLSDVANVVMGQSPDGNTYNKQGAGLPLLNGPAEFGTVSPIAVQWTSEPSKIAKPGDILFCVRGNTLGRQNLADKTYAIGRGLAAIRGLEGKADTEYIGLWLRFQATALLAAGTGSTFPSVSADYLEKLAFPPIGITEQQRIAGQLKAQLAIVEEARQPAQARKAEFSKLRARLTAQAFDGIHEAHPVFALRDVAKIASGITLGRRTKETNLISVPYLRVANVQDGQLDLSEVKVIEATPTEIGKWRLRDGDLLLTEGGDLDKLGRGTFWQNELPVCIHQNHIFRVRFSLDQYDPSFVALQVNSGYGKEYFLAHAKKTTGIATINQQVLGSFPLVSPPLQEQWHIAAQLSSQLANIDQAAAAAAGELAEIEQLPARLLAQVFGEH